MAISRLWAYFKAKVKEKAWLLADILSILQMTKMAAILAI